MLMPLTLILLTLFDFFTPGRIWAEPPDPVWRAGCVRAYHRTPRSESPVASARLEFQLCRERWQEHLHADYSIRVWVAGTTQLVAELPMPLVGTILTQFVAQAGLTAAYLGLPEAARRPLASAPPRNGPLPVGVPPKGLQAARKAARLSRAGRAGRKAAGGAATGAVVAILALLLAGCSMPMHYFTFPPGHTQQDFQRDLRVCQMDSQTVQMNTWMGGRTPGQIDRRFVACMRQLGYTETRADR